jgi:hypothetical protein
VIGIAAIATGIFQQARWSRSRGRRTIIAIRHAPGCCVIPATLTGGGALESRVQPVLRPMLRGNGTIVSPEKASALATWATKAAVLWEYLDPAEARIVPDWYRNSLREHTQPPPKTLVLAGSLMEGAWSHRTAQINLVIGHQAVAEANAIGTEQVQPGDPKMLSCQCLDSAESSFWSLQFSAKTTSSPSISLSSGAASREALAPSGAVLLASTCPGTGSVARSLPCEPRRVLQNSARG